MRSTLASTLVLGALILSGCDASSDDLALSISPATYPAPGEDEVSPMIGITLRGYTDGNVVLPACPGPTNNIPILGRERFEGGAWVLKETLASCDGESTTETITAVDDGEPWVWASGPREAGSYRWWLWMEAPNGERRKVYSPILTVGGE